MTHNGTLQRYITKQGQRKLETDSINHFKCCTPVSRFQFTWIDLALNSRLANQPSYRSRDVRARDQWQRTPMTPRVGPESEFFVRVSRLQTFN